MFTPVSTELCGFITKTQHGQPESLISFISLWQKQIRNPYLRFEQEAWWSKLCPERQTIGLKQTAQYEAALTSFIYARRGPLLS